MKQFLLIIFISVLSFNQTTAQESKTKLDVLNTVSCVKSQPIVIFNTNVQKSSPTMALNKKAFKNKINLKLKGKINLFKVKRRYNLC